MPPAIPPDQVDSLNRPGENIALLSFALSIVREAAFLIDGNFRIRYVNDEACRSLEYTSAELLSLGFADIDPDCHPAMMPDCRGDLRSRGSLTVESRFRTKGGRFYPVEISANYFEYAGQGYNLALVRDISERHAAEEAIRVNETRLRATLDNTPNVAVQWYDAEGRVQYWNAASETFYGWASTEAIGKTLDQLIHTPEEAAEFLRILDGIRDTGKPYGPYEAPVHRRDGRAGWVLATTFGIPMGGGQTGFVCMDVDITELKQAEEALRDSEASLRSLAETAFEGIMIHDQGLILEA
ncbi:MAG: hrpX, partial [bacterium]